MPRVTGRTQPASPGAARFERAGEVKTKVAEASDVTALPGDRFLVVGDKSRTAVVIDPDGTRTEVRLEGLKKGHSQLEGVAYDAEHGRLFVAREEKGQLLRYDWDARTPGAPVLDEAIELRDSRRQNKGVEGLAFLPAAASPTGTAQLLLAHEGKPRSLSLVDADGSGRPTRISLEREVLAVCRDFSAAAVDPKTGDLFVSSDESATVAQVHLTREGDEVRGRLVQVLPLRNADGAPLERVEGLAFNQRGDLFVLTENDGVLHRLARR